MKILLNFADDKFKAQQKFNSTSALSTGGFDKVLEFSSNDIDPDFYNKHKEILDEPRGAGYWLWKPYFIYKSLLNSNEGDYLFYCDSGSYFTNSINLLIDCMNQNELDLMPFECPLLNIQYSKLEFVEFINNTDWLYKNQTIGTFLLVKNSPITRKIILEFLELCTVAKLIKDPKLYDKQHDLYIAHRHDQTILSYVLWKNNITAFRDPSQYGMLPFDYIKYGVSKNIYSLGKFKKYITSSYPTILIHYRRKNIEGFWRRKLFEFSVTLKQKISFKLLGF